MQGLTLNRSAKLIGLKDGTRLSLWEKGQAMPSVENLFKLAILYRVTPQELYPALFLRLTDEVRNREDNV